MYKLIQKAKQIARNRKEIFSRNIKSFCFSRLESCPLKYNNFLILGAGKFDFLKYMKFFQSVVFFYFLSLESSTLRYKQNMTLERFISRNLINFLNFELESSIFRNITFFLFLDLESSISWNIFLIFFRVRLFLFFPVWT